MAEGVVISAEDDLWSLLEGALAPSPALPEISGVGNWRPRLIYLPDEAIGHSITPGLARAISGFHGSLCRAYAFLSYGQPNAALLRAGDREALDIRMLVIDGSDGIEVTGEALGQLVSGLISKMSGGQITLGIVLFLLLHFSATIAGDWIHEQHETKRGDRASRERVEMSEQETKRLSLVAKALEQHPQLRPIADASEDGKDALVRGVTNVRRAEVLGTSLTGAEARVIVSKPREASYGKRMDGHYEVVEINIENPDGYMGQIRNVITDQEFSVAINRAELTEDDIQALFTALREKTTVDARVNAWFQGDKITSAAIVRADPHHVDGTTSPPTALPPSPRPQESQGGT